MIKKKKTMYEILEISPHSTQAEIRTAHELLTQKFQLAKTDLNREDIDFKIKLINFAYHTLSVPMSRDAYDAQLAISEGPENNEPSNTGLTLSSNPDVISLKAEALLLRADAASLRADALMLRSDATTLRSDASAFQLATAPNKSKGGRQSLFEKVASMFVNSESPFKKLFTIIGAVVAFWMVIQVMSLLFSNRQPVAVQNVPSSMMDEKVYIQNYYQETGIRVGSKREADLIDAENRNKENEKRVADDAQRAKEAEERKYEKFVEESRRIGDKVSENLRQEEERAKREDERKQERLDEIKRRQEQAESDRIERELDRHRRNLNMPVNNGSSSYSNGSRYSSNSDD